MAFILGCAGSVVYRIHPSSPPAMIQGEALETMGLSLPMMDKKSAGIDQVWATPSEIQYFMAHVPGSQRYLQWMLFLPAFLYHGIKYFIIWYIKTFICDVKNEPEQMMRYKETLLTAHPQRIKLSAKAAIYQRYQVWPHLDSVQIPVALAYAPTDTLHSSANIRLMAERLPHATSIACPSNKYMHSADVMRDIEAFVLMSAQQSR
jgi:hypothetical protein